MLADFLASKQQLANSFGFKPIWMPSCMKDFQHYLTDWNIRRGRAGTFANCGLGKGQPPDSVVLTPSGWKIIGSLLVGDRVISSSGRPSIVNGVYPKPVQDTYRVWFSDKSSYVVDLDHQHICRTNNDRQLGKKWRVKSTAELISCGNLRYGVGNKSRNYDIPVVADVQFDAVDLPMDPYLIGVLLGDGHLSGNIQISSADLELVNEVRRLLPNGINLEQKSRYDWLIKTGLTGNRRHPFRQILEDLNLLGTRSSTKFIPEQYLYSSPSQRLSLLRGLMDTDGYIDRGGTCQYYSVSSSLANGVVHLIRSLGGIPTSSIKQPSFNGKPGMPCHMVTFSLATHNPFLLNRKSLKWNPNPRDNGRWIDRIEFEKRQETVCISVDSEDSSYVTENFIVTHNTLIQLVFGENVVRHTNRPFLIATPLAVSAQTVKEGTKFGIEVIKSNGGTPKKPCIVVTNYEKLKHFDPNDFDGLALDESGCIKDEDAARTAEITEFSRRLKYRLLCTATAAPNDFEELGTSSEALGELGYRDMLTKFFRKENSKDHLGWGRMKFHLRKYAARDFWRWVVSWSRACRKPSDLGFDDTEFILPPLTTVEHVVVARTRKPGQLFDTPAMSLQEQQEERRRTINERCEKVASMVDTGKPAVAWCHLNNEGDLLTNLISGSVQISGSDSTEEKEEALEAFASGQIRVLVTKPSIAGYGLNWQHCAHQTFFPSHSFEQYYQSVRRCWRFGQKNPVVIDMVTSEGEAGVMANLQRKALQAEDMFANMVDLMNNELRIESRTEFTKQTELPSWLSKNK